MHAEYNSVCPNSEGRKYPVASGCTCTKIKSCPDGEIPFTKIKNNGRIYPSKIISKDHIGKTLDLDSSCFPPCPLNSPTYLTQPSRVECMCIDTKTFVFPRKNYEDVLGE